MIIIGESIHVQYSSHLTKKPWSVNSLTSDCHERPDTGDSFRKTLAYINMSLQKSWLKVTSMKYKIQTPSFIRIRTSVSKDKAKMGAAGGVRSKNAAEKRM